MDNNIPEDQSMPDDQSLVNAMKRSSDSSSKQGSHKRTKKASNEKNDPRITSKDQKKHKLALQDKRLPDGVELFYISKGETLLKGSTKGRGILCDHCNEVVSATMFESHAGRSQSKKPFQHIYLVESKNRLLEYASYIKLTSQKRVENNDLLCMVCQKSGDLVFCDGCPRSFHEECMPDTIFATKIHFCKSCQSSLKWLVEDETVSGLKAIAVKDGAVSGPKANNVKDGTVSRPKGKSKNDGMVSDPKGKAVCDGTVSGPKGRAVFDRTVSRSKGKAVFDRTVSGSKAKGKSAKPGIKIDIPIRQIACVLCRTYEFTEDRDNFNDLTAIVCEQCEKEHHIGCLKKYMNVVLKKLPAGPWYCSNDCASLHLLIEFLIQSGSLAAEKWYMDIAKKKLKGCDVDTMIHADMSWFAFSGKDACAKDRMWIPKTIEILKECFKPITDFETKEEFIPAMAYGVKMGSSDFFGVFNALLTVNHEVVTAGLFRVFGREFAELPLVGTRIRNQGKGFFQAFMVCFERLLSFMRVKKIVLPAAVRAKRMWIKKFGFTEMPPKTQAMYRETYTSLTVFQGTTLLQKDVLQGQVSSL